MVAPWIAQWSSRNKSTRLLVHHIITTAHKRNQAFALSMFPIFGTAHFCDAAAQPMWTTQLVAWGTCKRTVCMAVGKLLSTLQCNCTYLGRTALALQAVHVLWGAEPLALFTEPAVSQSISQSRWWCTTIIAMKCEAELTASVLKKRSKTHKRLKERFLIGWNRTKHADF